MTYTEQIKSILEKSGVDTSALPDNLYSTLLNALLNAEMGGGGLTREEVEKIVTDEVAKIVADAPEDFDTLKEMSDWISQHEDSAAAMNSAIQQNATDISDNANAIQTNANNIAKNETNISTLKKHVTGELTDSDFQEDSTVAMTKTVPSGMSNYAAISKIGGKTVKDEENQVLKNAMVESVVSHGKDNTMYIRTSIDGASGAYISSSNRAVSKPLYPQPNRLLNATLSHTKNTNALDIVINQRDKNNKLVKDSGWLGRASVSNYVIEKETAFVYIIAKYLGGNADIAVDDDIIVTTDALAVKTTLSIPDSDRNLPCFGYGINETVQNIRDYENGTYTQMVAEVDLSDLTWTYNADHTYFESAVPSNLKVPSSNKNVANIVCSIYKTIANLQYNNSENKTISISIGGKIGVCDTSYTDAAVFKEAMKGVKLVYELATPVVTDRSDILHPIRVETGGTITLQNEHSLDVPNTVVYKKEVSLNG